jgi:hypothetical protein
VFAVCLTENALCEAGVFTLAGMRNLYTTITAIRIINNPNHPIRPYCLNPTKLEEYVLAMEYFGKLEIETRKIERSPQYFRPLWTNIDHNWFDYELYAIRRGVSNGRFQAETFRILNEKYEHHSKIYTDGSKIRRKRRIRRVVLTKRKHNKKKTIPTKLDLQRWAISRNKRYLVHCEIQTKTSNHHRFTQHNNSSLRQKKIQEPKNSIDPKTDRSSIQNYHITMDYGF